MPDAMVAGSNPVAATARNASRLKLTIKPVAPKAALNVLPMLDRQHAPLVHSVVMSPIAPIVS